MFSLVISSGLLPVASGQVCLSNASVANFLSITSFNEAVLGGKITYATSEDTQARLRISADSMLGNTASAIFECPGVHPVTVPPVPSCTLRNSEQFGAYTMQQASILQGEFFILLLEPSTNPLDVNMLQNVVQNIATAVSYMRPCTANPSQTD
jgi:hypothetical protein